MWIPTPRDLVHTVTARLLLMRIKEFARRLEAENIIVVVENLKSWYSDVSHGRGAAGPHPDSGMTDREATRETIQGSVDSALTELQVCSAEAWRSRRGLMVPSPPPPSNSSSCGARSSRRRAMRPPSSASSTQRLPSPRSRTSACAPTSFADCARLTMSRTSNRDSYLTVGGRRPGRHATPQQVLASMLQQVPTVSEDMADAVAARVDGIHALLQARAGTGPLCRPCTDSSPPLPLPMSTGLS
jgi:hypothetical protein